MEARPKISILDPPSPEKYPKRKAVYRFGSPLHIRVFPKRNGPIKFAMDFVLQNLFFDELEQHKLILKSTFTKFTIVYSVSDLKQPEDTFCQVTFNKQVHRTSLKTQSATPTWKETFTFNLYGLTPDVYFTESINFEIFNTNNELLLDHSSRLQDIDLGQSCLCKDKVENDDHMALIEYRAFLIKTKNSGDTSTIVPSFDFLNYIQDMVLAVTCKKLSFHIVIKGKNMPQDNFIQLRASCNNVVHALHLDPYENYWNKVLYFPLSDVLAKDFFGKTLKWEIVKRDEVVASLIFKLLDFSDQDDEEFESDMESHLRSDTKVVFSAKLLRRPTWYVEKKRKNSSLLSLVAQTIQNVRKKGSIDGLRRGSWSNGSGTSSPTLSSIGGLIKENRKSSTSSMSPVLTPTLSSYSLMDLLNDKRKAKREEKKSRHTKTLETKTSDLKFFKDDVTQDKSYVLPESVTNNINYKLYFAIEKDNLEDFSQLIKQKGVDVHWKHPYDNKSLLFKAVFMDRSKFVDVLLDSKFNVNEQDVLQRTPLFIACARGNREIMVNLLGRGANVNHRDGYGYNPLFVALRAHHFHLTSDLILFRADINQKRENGMSVLHDALCNNDVEMFDEIIKIEGLRLNIKDGNQKTPLLRCCEKVDLPLFFKFFNMKGVDICAFDEHGRNVFHLLALYQRHDILEEIGNLPPDDLEKLKSLLNSTDLKRKATPLSIAVENNSELSLTALKYLCQLCEVEVNWDALYEITFQAIDKEFQSIFKFNPMLEHFEIMDKISPQLYKMEQILFSLRNNRSSRRMSRGYLSNGKLKQ